MKDLGFYSQKNIYQQNRSSNVLRNTRMSLFGSRMSSRIFHLPQQLMNV